MPFEITMPQLGLTMEKGTVIEWLVAVGDWIKPDQEIVQVETDKAIVAITAHQEGTIARILVPAGQEVPVGTVLAIAISPGEWLSAEPYPEPVEGWQPTRAAATAQPTPVTAQQPSEPLAAFAGNGVVQASWKARDMARAAGLDLRTVAGSGPGGRIVAGDVARLLAKKAPERPVEVKATPVAINLASALRLDLSLVSGSGLRGQITQADVLATAAAIIAKREATRPAPASGLPQVVSHTPLKGVRKIVSEGMARSTHTTARVTLFREVDVSEFIKLRERFIARGLDVSYNDLLIRVCAIALREHPAANARLGEGQIEYLDRINIGLAVDTERGLLVPVVHNADRLTTPQIVAQRARLVAAARAGRSLPDELTGGTFTITNLGMLGVEGFTPIVNLPECCILGVGKVVRKPVVVDDKDTLDVRPTMTLSLVFDHRVIDGAPAARFLDRIAQLIQDPLLLLTVEE